MGWKRNILDVKWRFDVGRGVTQNYLSTPIRNMAIVAGAILGARAGTTGVGAWLSSLPLWLAPLMAGMYLIWCYAVGCLWVDVAKVLRQESEIALQVNAPMQEVIGRLGQIEAVMKGEGFTGSDVVGGRIAKE